MTVQLPRQPEWQNEEWFRLLKAQAAARTQTEIAREIGYARTSVSLLLSGQYPRRPTGIATRILEVYGAGIECPFLGGEIPRATCDETRLAPMPTHRPSDLRHWTACQSCPVHIARKRKPIPQRRSA